MDSHVGRCWSILTGERGHYELAAGRDPKPFIAAIENFSNQGGMITEQLWDGPDLPDAHMKCGCPTGAAMPLCWSHAEYVSLVRSRHEGVCFDCVEPAFQRYVLHPVESRYEIWSLRHPLRRVSRGKILRIILAAQAMVVWSTDGGARTNLLDTIHESELNLWFTDLPTVAWPAASVLTFTFFWKRDQRWEGRDWQVNIL
jgi:glucoamylase